MGAAPVERTKLDTTPCLRILGDKVPRRAKSNYCKSDYNLKKIVYKMTGE